MRQYLDLLDRVLTTAVKPQLRHLEGLSVLFIGSFDTITLTEKGYVLSSMMMGTRRLKKSIDKAEREQSRTLILKADFDAREIRGKLRSILGRLDPYITAPTESEETADLEDMLEADNSEGLLSADERGGDVQSMRMYLLKNYYTIYSKMKESAARADKVLENLSLLQASINTDSQKRGDLWRLMNDDYLKNEWRDQKAMLEYRIRQELSDQDNKGMSKIQILERELFRLKIDHIDNIYKRELKELNKSVVYTNLSAVDVLMKHRNSLREEDISDYFCFYYSHKFIIEAKEALRLTEASDYDILFYNRAAQEYVETLIPVIKEYGGINDKGHYGILKLVFHDLGLADPEKSNGTQMMDFVNEKMIAPEEKKLPRQDSITLMTGKLNKQSFAQLKKTGLKKTKLNDKEYARIKDIYWRCFTILNYCQLKDVADAGYDDYLKDSHPFTQNFDPWGNINSDTKNRLSFLSFVLKGENNIF